MRICDTCLNDSWLGANLFLDAEEDQLCDSCSRTCRTISHIQLKHFLDRLENWYQEFDGDDAIKDDPKFRGTHTFAGCLQKHWGIFGKTSIAIADKFIACMYGEAFARTLRVLMGLRDSDHYDEWARWKSLVHSIQHQNRYFPQDDSPPPWMLEVANQLMTRSPDPSSTWYRSRNYESGAKETFPIKKMGAPPPAKARAGRANPEGIPYLYLSTDPNTAVAELRPHTGEGVSIVRFSVKPNLKIVDFSACLSPFSISEEKLNNSREPRWNLLVRNEIVKEINEMLSRPAARHMVPRVYVPTQYICELLKSQSFDGVLYRSALGDGKNLALFDAGNGQAVAPVRTCQVQAVKYKISPLDWE